MDRGRLLGRAITRCRVRTPLIWAGCWGEGSPMNEFGPRCVGARWSLVQRQADHPVSELGGELGGGAGAVLGGELHQIEAYDPAPARDLRQQVGDVVPAEAARLGRAHSR